MIPSILIIVEKNLKTSTFYLLLLVGANIGLLIPQTRLLASFVLVCLLPGYLLSDHIGIWKDPFSLLYFFIKCCFFFNK
jgi:hypothetical protein